MQDAFFPAFAEHAGVVAGLTQVVRAKQAQMNMVERMAEAL